MITGDVLKEMIDNRDSQVETVLNSTENNMKENEDIIASNKDSL